MAELFGLHGIWEGLRTGQYHYNPLEKVRIPVRPGHQPSGGFQVFHKWLDSDGNHMVTTHSVVDADGWPVHWCEKDVIIGNAKYIHRHSLDGPNR